MNTGFKQSCQEAASLTCRFSYCGFSVIAICLLLSLTTFASRGAEKRQLGNRQLSDVDVTALLEQRLVKVGTINSNDVSVALENLKARDSLGYLTNGAPVGLVISIFVDTEDRTAHDAVTLGELARAVRTRIESASPRINEKVGKFLDGLNSKEHGDVVGLNLGFAAADRMRFPVDRLIIVIFKKGHSDLDTAALAKSMMDVLSDAKRSGLAALVVPCIGYRWDDKRSLRLSEVFNPLFEAMDKSRSPIRLFISLYANWPTFVIEDAATAINRSGRGLKDEIKK